eukprot:TRINITY_DN6172_c0_g1_i1.p1 TRINITY_DN6172_c0_g1~~TRINITY_DN6172_c0_g1_i1.p1  ORF type:complete len:271 (+),score=43.69 TRINITY_DN6172_c0_g1_i1:133-945(+)
MCIRDSQRRVRGTRHRAARAMSHSHGSGTKRVQCKYFLHGACGKGDSCHFSHDLGSSKPNMVCRFYQAGSCSYGSTCRYDHVKADQPPIQPSNPPTARPQGVSRLQSWSPPPVAAVEKKPTAPAQGRNANELLCPFAAAARCQRPNCPYLHGLVCPNCEKQCLHPTDTKAQEKHFAECGASRRRQRQVTTQQAEVSQGVECGICLEEVTADSRASAERRFGLLEGCNHAFCLECIRNWRQGGAADAEVVRSCPICRAVRIMALLTWSNVL